LAKPLEKVLYVEDEADIRAVAEIALAQLGGLEVQTCTNGLEAPDAVKRFLPDLVLLDVMMPGMDGVATLAALRADPAVPRVPVAFMTARTLPDEIANYLRLGAIGVIGKPFDPLKLAGEVRALWLKHQEQQR
jgi:two-component system OmpR family response regulator